MEHMLQDETDSLVSTRIISSIPDNGCRVYKIRRVFTNVSFLRRFLYKLDAMTYPEVHVLEVPVEIFIGCLSQGLSAGGGKKV